MPNRIRRARASLGRRATNDDAPPDNRLAVLDNALFTQHRAIGRNVVIQVVWIYEHAVDFDGVRLFNRNLGDGLAGRRIERSPLPFARHRWVSDRGPADIDIAETARPRAEMTDWADERARLLTDPEGGPGWRIGVLPLTDGSTAISLVISHYLIDGFGLALTIAEAVLAKTRDLGYPPPLSRTRSHALAQDARETAQDASELGRALVAAARLAGRGGQGSSRSAERAPVPPGEGDGADIVVVPVITVHVKIDDWEARAKALGGTTDTLVAGFAAKFAERIGRRRATDGAVTLQLPMSDRTAEDTRAVAVSYARLSIDPTGLTTDLGDLRTAIKQALKTMREASDEAQLQLAWLTPFVPKRALKRMADAAVADPDLPVFCSNLGDLGVVVFALAQTEDEYATINAHLHPLHLIRVIAQRVTRQWLEQAGGHFTVQSWRIGGRISITVEAYQPGADNTKAGLRELAARTLADFDLTGEVD